MFGWLMGRKEPISRLQKWSGVVKHTVLTLRFMLAMAVPLLQGEVKQRLLYSLTGIHDQQGNLGQQVQLLLLAWCVADALITRTSADLYPCKTS